MVAKKSSPLVGRVWAELGRGRIRETYIEDRTQYVDGLIEGNEIWINPAPAVVETVIHELLHRMYPDWSERYVANRTTFVMRRMTDQDVQAFYQEYQRVKRSA